MKIQRREMERENERIAESPRDTESRGQKDGNMIENFLKREKTVKRER